MMRTGGPARLQAGLGPVCSGSLFGAVGDNNAYDFSN